MKNYLQRHIPIGNVGLHPVQHIESSLVDFQEHTIENLVDKNNNNKHI